MDNIIFITLVASDSGARHLWTLVNSLREFGGRFRDCQFWIFTTQPEHISQEIANLENVRWFQLELPDNKPDYLFSKKVSACAQAERICATDSQTLVWLNPESLILHPPSEFELAPTFQAAFRPVHIQNIGSPIDHPPDPFWQAIYEATEIDESAFEVKSFIDQQRLRPYFNTHLFAFDASSGLMRGWQKYFSELIEDRAFQSAACQDELHRIFLHQAVLSAVVVKMIPPQRILILSPGYSYPLHLHDRIPSFSRAHSLDELTVPVYEDDDSYPLNVDIEIEPGLRSWLIQLSDSSLTQG